MCIRDRLRGEPSSNLNEEDRLTKELMDLKIKNASGQLKEISMIKETRKAIAQLKTILKEETKKKES